MNAESENLLQLSLISVTYAVDMRFCALILLFPTLVAAGEIFTRDGVTDGDTFYLAPRAMADDDPVLQSWVTYSLMRSTCKLKMGGDLPSRNSSFDCEFRARRHLAISWDEKRQADPDLAHHYLDAVVQVLDEGFLAEYVVHYHGKRHWQVPEGLRIDEFARFRREHLRKHKPRTRLIGSWNYATKTSGAD